MMARQLFQSITGREWRFVFLLSAFVAIITVIPLVYGHVVTPRDFNFTATHFTAPNDWFVYYAYIEQVRQGHWLLYDLFTAESHQAVFNPLWLGVGLLARITGLSAPIALNLVRVVLIPIFYVVAYLWIALLFKVLLIRRLALVMLSFASGLGAFLFDRIIRYPFNFDGAQFNWPMDLWVPEHNTFLTLYYSPHFVASLIFILISFLATVLFAQTSAFRYSFVAGISALVLFSFHPFHVPTVFGVTAMFVIGVMFIRRQWSWSLVSHAGIVGALSAPAILYYTYLLSVDQVTQQKALQNLTWTTPLWLTVVSYGLLLPLAFIGARAMAKQGTFVEKNLSLPWVFVLIWTVVQSILIYVPVDFQRRMTEGLHVPLIFLSTVGIVWCVARAKHGTTGVWRAIHQWRYTAAVGLGALLISSNVFQIAADLFIYHDKRELAYISTDIVDAGRWLRTVPSNVVVFNSASNIVNVVPALSGRRVYVGHGVETPGFEIKDREVTWFLGTNRALSGEEKFLHDRGITYIFFGPIERALGTYDPTSKPYLLEVYKNQTVRIYKVL